MADYTRDVYRLLNENKCEFIRRGKGDHNIYYSPIKNNNFSVDGKITIKHMANKIMKDAGIDFKF
jgi:hypothetical protein